MQMTAEDRLPSLFEMTLNNPKQQGRTRFTPAIAAALTAHRPAPLESGGGSGEC